MADESRWDRNADLLRARLERELDAGRDVVEDRIAHLFTGVLGRVMNPVVKSIYHVIGEDEVRRRVRAQLEVVVNAARDADAKGRDAALETWTPRALESEELVVRGNRKHARYPEVVRMLEDAFAERVDAIGTFLARADGVTYEEAVRTAFPDRAELEALLERHFARARRLVDLVDAEPGLVRIPRRVQEPLLRLVREVFAWYETRVQRDLDAIYSG